MEKLRIPGWKLERLISHHHQAEIDRVYDWDPGELVDLRSFIKKCKKVASGIDRGNRQDTFILELTPAESEIAVSYLIDLDYPKFSDLNTWKDVYFPGSSWKWERFDERYPPGIGIRKVFEDWGRSYEVVY